MWELIETPKTLKVTRNLAKEFAEMEPAPKDRPMSERRLAVYEKLIRRGEFRPMSWASIHCKETGSTYRVNGKHTSTLCSTMEQMPPLYAIVERYECADLEDVGRLYSTYDSKMQSRNTTDINRSFASCVPSLVDVPTNILNVCAGGISFATYFDSYSKQEQPQERAEHLLEHDDFVVWLHNLRVGSGDNKNNHLIKIAVVACMFNTYSKSKKDCTTFWESVRDEDGAAPDLPDRKLARYLLTNGTRRYGRASEARPATNKEIYCKCVTAFNAWRKGVATNLNYYTNAPIPDVV